MSTGDAILGLAGLYLLWQQNQIFRQQNEIFAAQAGASKMPSDNAVKIWLKRYWPMLLMVPLVLLMWAPIGLDYYGRYFKGHQETQESHVQESPLAPWLLLVGVLLILGHAAYVRLAARPRSAQSPSTSANLRILSAVYGTGPMDYRDVTERLRNLATEGLVVQVDNNTLGCDPAPNRPKKLVVKYSYLNEAIWETARPEHSRLILPEDKEFIEKTAAECERKRVADIERLEVENTDLRRQLAMRPTPQDLVTVQNENADLKGRLASVPSGAASSPQRPPKTPATMQRFSTVQSRFAVLKVSQRVALRLIYSNHGTLRFDDLVSVLEGMEFREPKKAVEYLLNNTSWIDQDFANGGRLNIAPAVIEDIAEILENTPII